MRTQTWSACISVLLLLVMGNTWVASKEQEALTAQEKAEAKEAEEEDARAIALDGEVSDPLKYLVIRGKLNMDEGAKGPVLGSVMGEEASYLIKLEHPNDALVTELRKQNGKEVTLG